MSATLNNCLAIFGSNREFVLCLTFLQLLMDKAFYYSQKWRFDFYETKSGVVTFGEHGPHHFPEENNRSWKLGDEVVEQSKSIRI